MNTLEKTTTSSLSNRTSKAVYTTLGASSHSKGEREVNDYYATPPNAVEMLLQLESFQDTILEPFCGERHISNVLESHGYNTITTDLIDRGNEVKSYTSYTKEDLRGLDIISNPPYKCAGNIVKFFLDRMEDNSRLALYLKVQFLESQARRELFKMYPPRYVYVSSSRLGCAKNGDFKKSGTAGAVCYCWYIWDKGFQGEPQIRWFN